MINTPRKAMDRALEGPLTLRFPTAEDAEAFRHACYVMRGRAQRASRKIYSDPSDPMYDTSSWDFVRIARVDNTLRFRTITIDIEEEYEPDHDAEGHTAA